MKLEISLHQFEGYRIDRSVVSDNCFLHSTYFFTIDRDREGLGVNLNVGIAFPFYLIVRQ